MMTMRLGGIETGQRCLGGGRDTNASTPSTERKNVAKITERLRFIAIGPADDHDYTLWSQCQPSMLGRQNIADYVHGQRKKENPVAD